MREQEGWDEHAAFMDGLVEDRFILLGGPLEGDRDTLHVVDAPSEEEVRARFAAITPQSPTAPSPTTAAVFPDATPAASAA